MFTVFFFSSYSRLSVRFEQSFMKLHDRLPLHSAGAMFSMMYFSSSNSSSRNTLFGEEAMVASSVAFVSLPTPTAIVLMPLPLICLVY